MAYSPLVTFALTVYMTTLCLVAYAMLGGPSPFHSWLTVTAPAKFLNLFGAVPASKIRACYDYTVNQPNPLMQTVYLLIVTTAYALMILNGYPLIGHYSPNVRNPYLDDWHKLAGYATYAICYTTFFKACGTTAGWLREETLDR